MKDFDLSLNFLKEIEKLENSYKCKSNIFDVFKEFILSKHTQESNYLLEYMIEHNFLDPKFHKNGLNFLHHMSREEKVMWYFSIDWELHRQYIKEGVNPSEISKIIRNDENEKLQEISSQPNFNFNQIIPKSIYERYSFINQYNVSLIDYAAFFGSVKCFKYLLMNDANVNNAGKYAIAGGNAEIIHLCEQNHSTFKDAYEAAIEFHRNDIFKYLYDNKIIEINNLENLGKLCILYHNYEILSFLLKEGMKINDDIINKSAKIGNLFLTKYFLETNQIPKNILVFSSGNIELVQYFLEQKGIDINAKNIYLFYLNFFLII